MNTGAFRIIDRLGVPLGALSVDSRRVNAATAFVAYPGESDDGRNYINEAVAAGTAGVFWDADNFSWRELWQVPNVAVPDLRAQCGYIADIIYGAPSKRLPLIAITGTNGKTTVAHFIVQLLAQCERDCGMIGTLGAGMPGRLAPLANTTPDAISINDCLQQFIRQGAKAAVLEASSHGIVHGRLNGLQMQAAVLTNATRDHLDYHGSVEKYWQAKAALFAMPNIANAIFNADDELSQRLIKSAAQPLTYGKKGNALKLLEFATVAGGMQLTVDGVLGKRNILLPIVGEYNAYNFMAAALVLTTLQISVEDIIQAATRLTLPAGRMQKINAAPKIYVDYAHTPAAMTAVLAEARTLAGGGRLILVCGAGGERDVGKRGEMGLVAATYADVTIITDDNPRNEDPEKIRNEVGNNIPNAISIGDRREAIATAIEQLTAADMLLVLGKGHETTQQIGSEYLPFSDADVILEVLAEQGEQGQ